MRGEQIMHKSAFFCLPIVLLVVVIGVASQTPEKDKTPADGKVAVEHVLRTQQEAWNNRDLDGFMAGYWNSAQLTFFSGAKQTSGWQATLDRYRTTYASPGHDMGTLEFSALRIQMLGPKAAFVRGAWHLNMPDGKTPHGLFTLVFRKFPEGWKIVHDHTSATE
jgi:beta-aspartyl-peptidase (threonine type)